MLAIEMDTNKYIALIRETIRQLDTINDVSPVQRAKELVKGAMGRSVRPKDPMFWPAGLLMLGLVQARDMLSVLQRGDWSVLRDSSKSKQISDLLENGELDKTISEIDKAILSYVDNWNQKFNGDIDYVDDALAGTAMVRMFTRTRDEAYRAAAEKIWDFIRNAPTDDEGSIIYNSGRKNQNIFADGVGQTAMFLSSYGREFDFAAALSLARTQLVNFKKYGMDKRSGLNYHGYELSEDKGVGSYPVEKKGLVGWGRAAGWLMMGLSEYLNCTDRKDTELALWYNELADLIFSYAKSEGGFSWLLPAVEGHLDTSATGMLLYGIRDAYSIEDLTPGIEALLAHTSAAGVVSSALSSCDDFAVHYQVYGDYPWGQGAALLAASVY